MTQFSQGNESFGVLSPEIKTVLAASLYDQSQTIEAAILKNAEAEAKARINNLSDNESRLKLKELALLAIVAGLKNAKSSDSSLYDYLVVGLMRQLDPFNMARFYRGTVCLSEKNNVFPRGFPFRLRQRAESVLIGKLKDVIGPREILDYLVVNQREKEIRRLEKDIAFATSQEVDGNRYARLMFEIRRLSVAPTNNEFFLRKSIIAALGGREEVNLIHIKCLRFVYPYGKELKVLPDLEDTVIPTRVEGRYFKPRGEQEFSARVFRLVELFRSYGVKVKLTILVAAEDLEILYPDDSLLIEKGNKKRVFVEVSRYLSCLKRKFDNAGEVMTLKSFLKNRGLYSRYHRIRRQCLVDIKQCQGSFIKDETFEKKVNSQFERYFRIFGVKYSRDEARRSAIEQAASMLALSVLSATFDNLIMLEEDKGPENKLIAGADAPHKVSVLFLELRDPSEFIENVC